MSTAQPSSLVERLDALYEYDREPVTADKLFQPAPGNAAVQRAAFILDQHVLAVIDDDQSGLAVIHGFSVRESSVSDGRLADMQDTFRMQSAAVRRCGLRR